MTVLASPAPHLKAHVEDGVGWLVLDRPERRNALDMAMWSAIPALIDARAGRPGAGFGSG